MLHNGSANPGSQRDQKIQAAEESDEVRRAELEKMAAILERVPAHPPRTFHECLQFYWIKLLNQRFMPGVFEGEDKPLFAAYLREWYEKGSIGHIQFNIVDSELLRDAQEHPERHANLHVRVAGYSAFWIDLPRETQDSIIARTEQSLGGGCL